jgi:pyruvate dehydrogenase E1 component alpha subunit
LSEAGVWTKENEEALLNRARADIDEAAAAYLATPPQPVEAMVRHLFADLPADLARQWREAGRSEGAGNG